MIPPCAVEKKSDDVLRAVVDKLLTKPVFAEKLLNVIEDVRRVENILMRPVSCVIKEERVEKEETAKLLTD